MNERVARALRDFFELEAAGGLLLVVAAILGLVAANGRLAGVYATLQDLPVVVKIGTLGVDKPLLLWINDGLMAIFFLLVALELKREMLEGQLAERSRLVLPAACALGGMLAPMAIYWLVNRGDAEAMRGVAVPAATDIAFALGALSLLGSRVPAGLKLLLTAIAVLDDLGAILLIALFYSHGLSTLALGFAGLAFGGLVLLNLRGVRSVVPYALLGALLWVAVLKSGVHATLAGVALGLTIPMRAPSPDDPDHSPLMRLEHDLHPTVAYAILPLFAFVNAGVSLAGLSWASLTAPVPLGIALGLVLGKPIGVVAAGGALIALGAAKLPDETGWFGFAGMGVLCGIGFTMSLFIGSLAFDGHREALVVGNRIGILAGTLVAAIAGLALVGRAFRARSAVV